MNLEEVNLLQTPCLQGTTIEIEGLGKLTMCHQNQGCLTRYARCFGSTKAGIWEKKKRL